MTWSIKAVDYWNTLEKICMYLADWFCLYGLILELCQYESDLNYLNCSKLGHVWRWYFGLYLVLFVHIECCRNHIISISSCAEFCGDQEYAKYRSCDLGIIVKKAFLLVFCRFLYNKEVTWYKSSIFLITTKFRTRWYRYYMVSTIFNMYKQNQIKSKISSPYMSQFRTIQIIQIRLILTKF